MSFSSSKAVYIFQKAQRNHPLPRQKAEIALGSSYQHLFTGMFAEAKVHFGFCSFEHRRGLNRISATLALTPRCGPLCGWCVPPASPNPAGCNKGLICLDYLCLPLRLGKVLPPNRARSQLVLVGGLLCRRGSLLALEGAATPVPLCREGANPES